MFLRNVLLLLPICAALGQDLTPKAAEWGPQAGPWQLSISAGKSQFSAGEPIEVVGTLKNVSDRPALFVNNTFSLFLMDVRLPLTPGIPWRQRAQSLPAARPQPGEGFHVISMDEPAGWETARKYDLGKLVDMSAPGEYRVTFSTTQPTRSAAEGAAGLQKPHVAVTSNEITITIVAAAK
jgi:hypothetical protein